MGNRLPWFPMLVADWFTGTADLTNAEKGAYIDLLCLQWNNGPLARVPTRYLDEWPALEAHFPVNNDGKFVNLKLQKIRKEKEKALEKQRLGGKRSAVVRSKQPARVPAKQPIKDPSATKSQSQSQSKIDTKEYIHKKRAAALFNEICTSLPEVKTMGANREKHLGARIKVHPDEQSWIDYFTRVEASDFLSGRNGDWTHCGFDWLILEFNMNKVVEGNYDNQRGRSIDERLKRLKD